MVDAPKATTRPECGDVHGAAENFFSALGDFARHGGKYFVQAMLKTLSENPDVYEEFEGGPLDTKDLKMIEHASGIIKLMNEPSPSEIARVVRETHGEEKEERSDG